MAVVKNIRVVSDDDLVPSEWSDGETETVEQWGNRQYDFGKKTGYELGVKEASNKIRTIAADLFVKEKGGASDVLNLAKEIDKLLS